MKCASRTSPPPLPLFFLYVLALQMDYAHQLLPITSTLFRDIAAASIFILSRQGTNHHVPPCVGISPCRALDPFGSAFFSTVLFLEEPRVLLELLHPEQDRGAARHGSCRGGGHFSSIEMCSQTAQALAVRAPFVMKGHAFSLVTTTCRLQ